MTAQLQLDLGPAAPTATQPEPPWSIDELLAECRRVRPEVGAKRWSREKHPESGQPCACWMASDCGVLVQDLGLHHAIAEAWTGGVCVARGDGVTVESALRDLACYRPSVFMEV